MLAGPKLHTVSVLSGLKIKGQLLSKSYCQRFLDEELVRDALVVERVMDVDVSETWVVVNVVDLVDVDVAFMLAITIERVLLAILGPIRLRM